MSRGLVVLCLVCVGFWSFGQGVYDSFGALVRSDTTQKEIHLIFTGHDFDDGFDHVIEVLNRHQIAASFFLTGDFVRSHRKQVQKWHKKGHFIGGHSDKHILYNDWQRRDSLLVSEQAITKDIADNLSILNEIGIYPRYFMPPYEWYNRRIVELAQNLNQNLVNFTSGTRSNADYTTPEMKNYISSDAIWDSILNCEARLGMKGFHLLIHPGVSPDRKDKFYLRLDALIGTLKAKEYRFVCFD